MLTRISGDEENIIAIGFAAIIMHANAAIAYIAVAIIALANIVKPHNNSTNSCITAVVAYVMARIGTYHIAYKRHFPMVAR